MATTTTTDSRVSRRGRSLPASPIRRLHPHAVAAQKRGVAIYHVNIGQPDVPTPEPILNRLRAFSEPVVAYGPSQGRPEFVDTLIQFYRGAGMDLGHDDLLVTTGGSEALIMAFTVLLEPGDEVLVPEPFYSNYNGFAAIASGRVVPVTTSIHDGFHLPPKEAFQEAITDRTKILAVCSPNNPTGTVFGPGEMDRLAELALEHDLTVVTDEPYREIVFDGPPATSLMTRPELADRVVMVDSLSKRYSLCGARIGCLATRNREIYTAALRFGMARLCPPTVAQWMAMAAVELGPDYLDEVRATYKARRDAAMEVLGRREDIVARPPEGAFYVIAGLPVDDAQSFCAWMLDEFSSRGETVMMAPADGFYATPGKGRTEVRIAFVLAPEKMRRAMEILLEGLEAYPGRTG